MINNRTIYGIQNISTLLDLLEHELDELRIEFEIKQKNIIFKHLIARTLFKSGRLNTNYGTNVSGDIIFEEIRRKMINDSRHRHLSRVILDEIYLPEQVKNVQETGLDVDLLGDLLIFAKNY